MQRHKSAKKAARQNVRANTVNREMRTRIKNATKKVLEAKTKDGATEALVKAFSVIDKSAKVKLIHSNNAANKKSRLAGHVNKLPK